MHSQQIVLYGAGGSARETAWLAESARAERPLVVECFIDDNPRTQGQRINDIPVLSLEAAYAAYPEARVVGAVGNPRLRETLMLKAAAIGFEACSLVHTRCEMSRWVQVGEGTVICAGSVLTTNIVLGRHVQINTGCSIGHDVVLGDFVTLTPGVHISGCVQLGKRVYVGTGAVIINGTAAAPLVIEDDVVIGAGACVTRSVPQGLTVVGVPAKPVTPPAR